MSLVNDMLRDLENRQLRERQQLANYGGFSVVGAPETERAGSHRLWLIPVALALLSAGMLAGGRIDWDSFGWGEAAGADRIRISSRFGPPAGDPADDTASLLPATQLHVAALLPEEPARVSGAPVMGRVAEDVTEVVETATADRLEVAIVDTAAGGDPGNEAVESAVAEPAPATPAPVAVRDEPVAAPLRMRVRRTPEELAAERVEHGLAALRAGNIQEAEESFRGALRTSPEDTRAHELLYSCLVRQGRTIEAEEILNAGLDTVPEPHRLAKLYGRALLDRGQPDDALRLLQTHRPIRSRDLEYDAFVAALLQQVGRHREAAELYEELVAFRPEHSVWWLGLGISLDALGQAEAALESYRRARLGGDLSDTVDDYAEARIAALRQP